MIRVPMDDLAPGERDLSAPEARYITRVHRLAPGDPFIAFDPAHVIECDAEVVSLRRIKLGPPRPATLVPTRKVTWVHAFPKADKADAIVRDVTELGATKIILVQSARTIAKPAISRLPRWERIAREAARQCGRGDAPTITLDTFPNVLTTIATPLRILLDPRGAPLRTAFAPLLPITFVAGPEGGFTPEELTAAEQASFTLCSLGPLTLRTETIPAAVLGALLATNAP